MDEKGFREGGEERGGETGGYYNNDPFEFRVEEKVSMFATASIASSSKGNPRVSTCYKPSVLPSRSRPPPRPSPHSSNHPSTVHPSLPHPDSSYSKHTPLDSRTPHLPTPVRISAYLHSRTLLSTTAIQSRISVGLPSGGGIARQMKPRQQRQCQGWCNSGGLWTQRCGRK